MNKSLLLIVVIIILGLGGIAYVTMTQKEVPISNTQINENPSPTNIEPSIKDELSITPSVSSEAMMENIKEFKIEAGSFYYKPNTITVKKGDKVKIEMNAVSLMHDFNIDELNVKIPIVQNGNTGTVEFTADKVGTFEYYCSVGEHRANGQIGTITVEE